MEPIVPDTQSIAACGLYCGACRKFLAGKCPGCKCNEKATWCKIRSCCQENKFNTCAECPHDVKKCKVFSNWIGKVFAFLFNSDRAACICYIKEHSEQAFAKEMTQRKCQTIRRK